MRLINSQYRSVGGTPCHINSLNRPPTIPAELRIVSFRDEYGKGASHQTQPFPSEILCIPRVSNWLLVLPGRHKTLWLLSAGYEMAFPNQQRA